VVAYGSTIRPAIATVKFTQPDGAMIKHTEPRNVYPEPNLNPKAKQVR